MLQDLVMTTPEATVLQEDLQDTPPPLFVTTDRLRTYFATGEMQSQVQEKIACITEQLQDPANLVLAGT